jgi:hypothetical protein
MKPWVKLMKHIFMSGVIPISNSENKEEAYEKGMHGTTGLLCHYRNGTWGNFGVQKGCFIERDTSLGLFDQGSKGIKN